MTGTNPPIESSCTYSELRECQIENCVDGDNDGHPREPQAGEVCIREEYDCDDTKPDVNPGVQEENCTSSEDDNCDGKTNCEDDQCRLALGDQCDEQCDQDEDGHYNAACGGMDCNDGSNLAFPGYGQPPHGLSGEASGSSSCADGIDNDCDGINRIDCNDSDCANSELCLPPGPIGGCNGPPFPNGTCSSGFSNSGGTCTRSNAFMNQCFQNGGDYDFEGCGCTGTCNPFCSPIIVDILGNGFDMTSAANGVSFDLEALGTARQFSWTASGSDEAWLALDRDRNGTIDNGKELFGNITSQDIHPAGVERNGFLALALYDGLGYGGNGDGRITRHDAIFDRLRLWQDSNHNGISESSELVPLPGLGLRRIDLDYRQSQRVDRCAREPVQVSCKSTGLARCPSWALGMGCISCSAPALNNRKFRRKSEPLFRLAFPVNGCRQRLTGDLLQLGGFRRKKTPWVDRFVVKPKLIMKMRPCRTSGRTDKTYHLSARKRFPDGYFDLR